MQQSKRRSRAFADYGCCGGCFLVLSLPLVGVVLASEWIDRMLFGGRGDSIPYTTTGLIILILIVLGVVGRWRSDKEDEEFMKSQPPQSSDSP